MARSDVLGHAGVVAQGADLGQVHQRPGQLRGGAQGFQQPQRGPPGLGGRARSPLRRATSATTSARPSPSPSRSPSAWRSAIASRHDVTAGLDLPAQVTGEGVLLEPDDLLRGWGGVGVAQRERDTSRRPPGWRATMRPVAPRRCHSGRPRRCRRPPRRETPTPPTCPDQWVARPGWSGRICVTRRAHSRGSARAWHAGPARGETPPCPRRRPTLRHQSIHPTPL